MTALLKVESIRCARPDGTAKTAIFKAECTTALPGRVLVGLFSTKRGARSVLAPYRKLGGAHVRRGPDHDRGETGHTRHAWSESHNQWVQI